MATSSQAWRDRIPAAPLAVGALATLVLVLADALVRDAAQPPRGDELIYERMADAPFDAHTFPFAYRFGLPLLVHVLPFGHQGSFSVLAWLASGACAGVLYVLLRRFGVSAWLAVALALALVLSPPLLLVSLRQGRNPDALAALAMLAGTLCVVDRRPRALAAVLLLGVTVRESTLFLIPFAYAMWARRPLDGEALGRVALVAAPAVAAYAAMRGLVPTVGREDVLGYDKGLVAGRREVLDAAADQPWDQARRVASAFGPLWLCLPFALRGMRFARAGLIVLGLAAASCLFALDWGRILFLAAPVVYVAGGWVLQRHRRAAVVVLAAFAAMNVGYAIHMDRSGVVDGIDRAAPPPYPVR
ncbi:MAG: hypothetical protein QOE65_824 [Solirubrobacteraceae bacterium]|jgi:hypothetical protein|nr:hypothetical protein [Solirubrobacteraceae bacterium]